MPLNFPISASVDEIYRSGSSVEYRYNGNHWMINTGSALTITSAKSASYTPSHRRDITQLGDAGYGGHLILADGKLYAHKAAGGYNFESNGGCTTTIASAFMPGSENITEVAFPGKTGNIVEVNSYGNSAYALFDNGDLYTWGNNTYGQLGIGTTAFTGLPTLSNTNVTKVWWDQSMSQGDPSYNFLVIQKTDGWCYGTGYNGQGQLGIGSTTSQNSWVQLTSIGQNPKFVGAWGTYVGGQIVQKADNTIIVCGWNGEGELGIGGTSQQTSFVSASGWRNGDATMLIQGIYAKNRYADGPAYNFNQMLVWLSNGTTDILMGAGKNSYGGCGDGSTTQRTSPVVTSIPSGKRIQKVVNTGAYVGAYHVLFTDGTLYGWGRNTESQLGNGNTTQQNTPVLITSNVLDIYQTAANFNYYTPAAPIIKKADGYYSWGQNDYGTAGDGTTTRRNSPVKMRFPQGVNLKLIGGGFTQANGNYRVAVTDTNQYYSWGYNAHYVVHPDYTDSVLVPIEYHPRALVR